MASEEILFMNEDFSSICKKNIYEQLDALVQWNTT